MKILLLLLFVISNSITYAQSLQRWRTDFGDNGLTAEVIRVKKIYCIEEKDETRIINDYYDVLGRVICREGFDSTRKILFSHWLTYFDTTSFVWDPLESTCRHASLSIL